MPAGEVVRNLLLPPFVTLFSLAVMVALDRLWPLGRLWSGPIAALGWLGVVVGGALAMWHARLFRRLGTNLNTFRDPGSLTTAGLFRRTRNPMYLGFVIAVLGAALALGSVAPWVVAAGFLVVMQVGYVRYEERRMRAAFGAVYEEYCQKVPRWL
jgi:protein-S-isoprenylcysteine O-methyltransferase Ste14